MIVWSCLCLGFAILYLGMAWVYRPSVAIAVVVPLTWLIPHWVVVEVLGERLDVKTTVSITALALYCFLPRATFPWRLVMSDYAVLGLAITQMASDSWNSGWNWATPAFAYVEWIVPYLAGRLAFQSREDIGWIWPVVAVIAIWMSSVTLFEAWFGLNPYEVVFGERPLDGVSRDSFRWGFRRSYGICLHPLYHGVFCCWLFGWLLYPAWRGLTGRSSMAWLFAPPMGMMATLATGSRGPFLGTFVVLAAAFFCRFPRSRGWFLIPFACLLGLAIVFQESALTALDEWTGELKYLTEEKKVILDGREEAFSSARARVTLFRIFWTPLTRAGWLGYGTEACSTFPVNIPTGADEVTAMKEISSVDNTYLLLTLRSGYLGLFFLLAFAGTAIAQLLLAADRTRKESLSAFCAGLFGTLVAVFLLIGTVWMPADIGFPLLWSVGGTAGITHFLRREPKGERRSGLIRTGGEKK